MKRSIPRVLGVLAIAAVFSVQVHADLLPPGAVVAGRTQNQWAEQWWNWVAQYPEATNPVSDLTGAYSSQGDQGQVFFLAGHFAGDGPVTRTATVRDNQHLFFPLANGLTTVLDSAFGPTYDGMR